MKSLSFAWPELIVLVEQVSALGKSSSAAAACAAVSKIPAVSRLVREFVRDVRRAQNLLVIKTIPGSAQPVAVAIDAEAWDEVVGTVAGDDTLLIITANNKNARKLHARLEAMQV